MFVINNFVCVLLMSSVLIVVTSANELPQAHPGLRAVTRVYDECHMAEGGFMSCLKKKAVTFLDRVGKIDSLNVGDGLKVIRSDVSSQNESNGKSLTENELEATLPRGLEARDEMLSNMLLERVARFFSSRTVQLTLPKISPDEIGRGIEEG